MFLALFLLFVASDTGWCTTVRLYRPLAYWHCCGASIILFSSIEALFVACFVTAGYISGK